MIMLYTPHLTDAGRQTVALMTGGMMNEELM